jgi:ribokinase
MENKKQKMLCIGSIGKDIFFPVSSGTVVDDKKVTKGKQFCFGYGGKVYVEDRFSALGGCACNISVGVSRLGIEAFALGNVGEDFDRDWILSVLSKEGVDVMNIHTIDKSDTDLSVIVVDTHTGERTIFANRDVGEHLHIEREQLKGYDWCFVGSLYGDGIETNMRLLHDACADNIIKLAYNPGGKNIQDDENIVLDLIHHASAVFVNKSEAQKIVLKFDLQYNEEEINDEAFLMDVIKKHMHSDGVVVLTDGLRGAWTSDNDYVYHTNTIEKAVVDTTGAGDAFASGFLASLLHGNDMSECMQWGSVNGDGVVEYYGAQEGLQNYDNIQEKIKMFPVEKIKNKK